MPSGRILIVEDNLHNIALLKAHLSSVGYETEVAHDGEECLEVLKRYSPDLILLDIMLPGLDGFEVCRILKQDKDTQFIPIMMLTALDEMETKIKGLECGADEVLTKPFVPLELLCRVRSLLRLKQLVEKQIELEREKMEMEHLIAVEESRKNILRDCIYAITGGKLEMRFERGDMERVLEGAEALSDDLIRTPSDVARIRNRIHDLCMARGLSEDRTFDICVCTSEAVTNALKHGKEGKMRIAERPGLFLLWVEDSGPGIEFSRLPSSTLMKGYSTKHSLGYGFTLMLEMTDRIHLSTGPGGTALILEMGLTESSPNQEPLALPLFSPSQERI
jgi:DNA-binding response OmpR family regulator